MVRKIARWILLIIGAVACALLFVVYLIATLTPSTRHLSDEEMLTHYHQNSAEFNQLAEMLLAEDELLVIFPDEGECQLKEGRIRDTAINRRCATLVDLFRQLGLNRAYAGPEPIRLPMSFAGLAVSGSTKGYLFTSTPPEKLVSDTDEWDGQSDFLYRAIEGKWYIFHEKT
ncbi:MAG: hypothetical protein R3248_13100 [Candidatus Promineifilaceae bacterium]|nr:hypothetical protein [Candidatus Promineifilaceae bacterium]